MGLEKNVSSGQWNEEKSRIAYQLWEAAGHPWGRDHEFWDAAEALLMERRKPAAPAGQKAAG